MPWIVEVNPPWPAQAGEPDSDQWVPVFYTDGQPDAAKSTFDRFTDATALKAQLDWVINAGLNTSVFGTSGPREVRYRDLAE